jgi:hypothetical protein
MPTLMVGIQPFSSGLFSVLALDGCKLREKDMLILAGKGM